ncbi:MAG: hypothetical protein RBU30_11410 [Polyangia bacterium]|jgi:hypothetical protein|nr:hypothetical protein [Polyangia bacterium]
MAYLALFLGLIALLVVLFKRAAGAAMLGSVLSLSAACVVVIWFGRTAMPEALGLLFIALAVGIWAATPPAEEAEVPLGDGKLYVRAHQDPGARASLPEGSIDPVTGDSMTAFDHLWLVGIPVLGWAVTFLALPKRTGFEDGVWFSLLAGTPGAGFAFGATDIAALFGLLLIFPGGALVLCLPLTGLVALLVHYGRGRPTAFSAAMEYAAVALVLNIISLLAIPLR